ncbi:MAG: ABC transporter permease [Kutzneria sp.]|nr:ABC transporter permease [Kutzneria sp.]
MITEIGIVFARAMRGSLRNPVWFAIGILQPVLYLALFGPLLAPVTRSPGFPPGDGWQVLVPGLLVQLVLFSSIGVGYQLMAEYRSGVLERMRVTPTSRAALLLGRVLRDIVVLVAQAGVLIVIAIPFGLRASTSGVLLGLALLAMTSGALSAAAQAMTLLLKDENQLTAVTNTLTAPLLLLSGVLLPMSLAPGWLHALSRLNPLAHTVDAMRALFLGHFADPAVPTGVVVVVLATMLAIGWGTRTFQRLNA